LKDDSRGGSFANETSVDLTESMWLSGTEPPPLFSEVMKTQLFLDFYLIHHRIYFSLVFLSFYPESGTFNTEAVPGNIVYVCCPHSGADLEASHL